MKELDKVFAEDDVHVSNESALSPETFQTHCSVPDDGEVSEQLQRQIEKSMNGNVTSAVRGLRATVHAPVSSFRGDVASEALTRGLIKVSGTARVSSAGLKLLEKKTEVTELDVSNESAFGRVALWVKDVGVRLTSDIVDSPTWSDTKVLASLEDRLAKLNLAFNRITEELDGNSEKISLSAHAREQTVNGTRTWNKTVSEQLKFAKSFLAFMKTYGKVVGKDFDKHVSKLIDVMFDSAKAVVDPSKLREFRDNAIAECDRLSNSFDPLLTQKLDVRTPNGTNLQTRASQVLPGSRYLIVVPTEAAVFVPVYYKPHRLEAISGASKHKFDVATYAEIEEAISIIKEIIASMEDMRSARAKLNSLLSQYRSAYGVAQKAQEQLASPHSRAMFNEAMTNVTTSIAFFTNNVSDIYGLSVMSAVTLSEIANLSINRYVKKKS